MRGPRRLAALVAVASAMALGGCGLGAGETPKDVTLRVSGDFGGRRVVDLARPRIAGEDTVMRLLRRNATVRTGFGGAFVTAIDGRAGGERADGGGRDWIYFVNGVFADRGATTLRVHDGDRIWWDLQDARLASVGAVVGSFPAPLRGPGDPVDVACAAPTGASCRTTQARLRAAGVRTAVRPLDAPAPPGTGRPTVLVGAWPVLRDDARATPLGRGPKSSGVLAVPVRGGLAAYDAAGRSSPLIRRWGLVAAMRPRGSDVVWLVTGGTERDATSAADALREGTLRGRFAVLVRGGAVGPLPTAARR